MITTPLFSAVVIALGGGHADLHPADTNFFFEVSEVRAVLNAYDEAPLARLVADPAIQEFVAKLTGQKPETVSFKGLIGEGLDHLRTELPEVGAKLLDLLAEVEHASFSVSGIELDGAAKLVEGFAGEISEPLAKRLSQVHSRLIMDFSSAEIAASAAELIRTHASIEGSGGDWEQIKQGPASETNTVEWSTHSLRDSEPHVSIFVAHESTRVTVGIGLMQDVDSVPPISATLAENPSYKTATEHMGNQEGVAMMDNYYSLSGVLELPQVLLSLLDGPEINLDGGFFQVAPRMFLPGGKMEARSTTRLVEGRFVTDSFVSSFATAECPCILSPEPVTKDSFRMAPLEAVGVMALNLDKSGLRHHLMDLFGEHSGKDSEALRAKLQSEHGLDPSGDLIDSLAGNLLFYNMPFQGIGMPKMFVVLELDDSEAFARGLEGLVAFLEKEAGDVVVCQSRPYRRQPFVCFEPAKDLTELTAGTGAGGLAAMTPAFISPSISVAILEDRAVFGLSSSFVKREVKRLLKAKEEPAHPVITSAEEFPTGAQSYGSTDWGAILSGLYDTVRGFLPMIEQGADLELPFSIEEMPEGEIFFRYIEKTVTWTRSVEGGWQTHAASSFGPEVQFMLAVGIGAGLLIGAREEESSPNEELERSFEVHQHTIELAGDLTAEESTRERLRSLKTSIQIFKAEHGHYPETLNDTVKSSEDHRHGEPNAHQWLDAWGQVIRYERDGSAESYKLWSTGPDGVDAQGEADDIILAK
ncbi:MAG: hypothetical protein ACI9F9_001012 [Candidatus Paceibacteria bacterium]|jgi:hypothetical protein